MSGLDINRRRNKTVCFRVSPDEEQKLVAKIKVSGLPKAEFIIQSLLTNEVKIAVGKYQSDRLSLEVKRLRATIEAFNCHEHVEPMSSAIVEIHALLEELIDVMDQKNKNGEAILHTDEWKEK